MPKKARACLSSLRALYVASTCCTKGEEQRKQQNWRWGSYVRNNNKSYISAFIALPLHFALSCFCCYCVSFFLFHFASACSCCFFLLHFCCCYCISNSISNACCGHVGNIRSQRGGLPARSKPFTPQNVATSHHYALQAFSLHICRFVCICIFTCLHTAGSQHMPIQFGERLTDLAAWLGREHTRTWAHTHTADTRCCMQHATFT